MPAAVARKVAQHPAHRFRAGERLSLSAIFNNGREAALCDVVSLVPYEGHGSLRYRVRSASEQFERIVTEADLLM